MGGRDGLEIPYDFYDSTGHRTGTVILTQEMYDAEHWCLFASETGAIIYYANNTGTLYIKCFADADGYYAGVKYLLFCNNGTDWQQNSYKWYDFSSQTWKTSTLNKLNVKNINYYNPSSIIKQKGMTIFYKDAGKELSPEWFCPPVDFPCVDNLSDIASGNFDNIYINLNDCFNFGSLESSFNSGTINIINTYTVNTLKIRMVDSETGQLVLNGSYADINENSSNFLDKDWVYYLVIPKDDLNGYNFVKDKKYSISIEFDFTVNSKSDDVPFNFTQKYVNTVTEEFTFCESVIPDKDDENTNKIINSFTNSIGEQTGAINNQTNAIKEQTEVNKNIFEKIGEMLSYINPFSENFFVYKLIELLIEMLKGLFIPSDEFFSSYFSDLNNWFSDRFGFLYYPLELFFDLADRFLHINFSEPIIDIPDIYEPTTNTILIHATKYNFNSLLEQNSFKTAHDIYLIIVDAIIYVGLVILLYNKYEEVMTK